MPKYPWSAYACPCPSSMTLPASVHLNSALLWPLRQGFAVSRVLPRNDRVPCAWFLVVRHINGVLAQDFVYSSPYCQWFGELCNCTVKFSVECVVLGKFYRSGLKKWLVGKLIPSDPKVDPKWLGFGKFQPHALNKYYCLWFGIPLASIPLVTSDSMLKYLNIKVGHNFFISTKFVFYLGP